MKYIDVDLNNEEKLEVIKTFYDLYYDTDQNAEDF